MLICTAWSNHTLVIVSRSILLFWLWWVAVATNISTSNYCWCGCGSCAVLSIRTVAWRTWEHANVIWLTFGICKQDKIKVLWTWWFKGYKVWIHMRATGSFWGAGDLIPHQKMAGAEQWPHGWLACLLRSRKAMRRMGTRVFPFLIPILLTVHFPHRPQNLNKTTIYASWWLECRTCTPEGLSSSPSFWRCWFDL